MPPIMYLDFPRFNSNHTFSIVLLSELGILNEGISQWVNLFITYIPTPPTLLLEGIS